MSCLSSPAPNCFQVTVSRPVAPPATDFISAEERPPGGAQVQQSADARHAALESKQLAGQSRDRRWWRGGRGPCQLGNSPKAGTFRGRPVLSKSDKIFYRNFDTSV